MRKKDIYYLTNLTKQLVEHQGAEPVEEGSLPHNRKEEIKSALWQNLEAFMENADADSVDALGTQYSGEHIAHELKPHGEVFYFDYPGGRIEINGPTVQPQLSLLNKLSQGYDIYEAFNTSYSDQSTLDDIEMHIRPALDHDGRLKPEYMEELAEIMK